MKLLITLGGTKEPIDSVRYISNISTGATGLCLAKAFLNAHYTTTILASSDIMIPNDMKNAALVDSFLTFEHLKNRLLFYLSSYHFDIVIHLSAVGDYFISDISIGDIKTKGQAVQGKISGFQSLNIKLKLNPKLLPKLKSFSKNKEIFVVGFKLTDTEDAQQEHEQIKNMLHNQNIDLLVHNRLSDITEKQHIATVYNKRTLLERVKTKKELSETLLKIFKQSLNKKVKNDFMS